MVPICRLKLGGGAAQFDFITITDGKTRIND
jgi:hypothetical protein